jgi:two-component system cell cycle sensor histidine kinase PleC
MLHPLVKRQLKKLGLDEVTLPKLEAWQQFLERVSQSYAEADRDRYLLERSLTISSREMQELYDSLQQSSEMRLTEVRAVNEKLQNEIIERKQVEAELAVAHEQALEVSRLKTELLAKVSHELRTPLGAILGFAEILDVGIYGALSTQQAQTVTEIIDSTHYLTSLVNELLDQAQLDAGKLKLRLTSFAPANLLDNILTKTEILANIKGLSLTANIAADMPALLTADLARLQQILVNLVSNAIKFTESGKVQVHLCRSDAAHWIMQVSDTGIGIPLEAQARIFEPFVQVDGSITREQAGSGLGLSIVKQLTHLMGGEITLESEVGQGTIFTVVLPLSR